MRHRYQPGQPVDRRRRLTAPLVVVVVMGVIVSLSALSVAGQWETPAAECIARPQCTQQVLSVSVALAESPGSDPAPAVIGPETLGLPTGWAQPATLPTPEVRYEPAAGSDGSGTAVPGDYSSPGGLYLDVLTQHRALADWPYALLDTVFTLGAQHYPNDLVDTSTASLNGGYLVRSLVVPDLREMANAARAAGAPIQVVSAFRSYAQQAATFQYWVGVGGMAQALRTSARPGHSEHQLGTTLDFTSLGGAQPWEYGDWATTAAGVWMTRNAWRYGFVMSYPPGSFSKTGYDYEPWHYRYVGRERAAAVHASGLTLREYLWNESA